MSAFERVAALGVVPVLAIDDVAHALPLADALIAGGLPVAEITFRTAAAAEVIRTITANRPELIVGAGTVLTPEQAVEAKKCGASFAVAPGFNPRVLARAKEIGLEFLPGIASPTELEAAMEAGCKICKVFPAEVVGGVQFISAVSAAYGHTGVRFMPTGGVNTTLLPAYLKLKTVAAVGGTWIAKKEDFDAGNWDGIATRCRGALAIVAASRESK